MIKTIKKSVAFIFAASMIMSQTLTVTAKTQVPINEESLQIASISATDYSGFTGENILEKIRGDYLPMFDSSTTFDTKYNQYWHDDLAAVGGASKADENEVMIKYLYGGQTYGDSAKESQYFCGFANDIVKITIGGDGRDITFIRRDGNLTKHRYKYEKDASITNGSIGANGFLFKSMDDIADGFKYLFISTDTPATTYHIELRYADTEEDVLNFTGGPYKNCLSYGISANAVNGSDPALLQKAIAQIVFDTLSETDEAKEQREDLTGIWAYNFSTAEQNTTVLDNAEMFFKNVKDGTGAEYRDAMGTGKYDKVTEYRYFVYDATPSDTTKSGTYFYYSPGNGIKVSTYSISSGEDGSLIVTFKTEGEQDASYTFREAIAPGKVNITSVKAKKKKITISWSAVASADRYQVLVSTDKNFKKITVDKNTDKTSITIKAKKKKTYFIKVRAYVQDALGENTAGDFSAVKKVKVK